MSYMKRLQMEIDFHQQQLDIYREMCGVHAQGQPVPQGAGPVPPVQSYKLGAILPSRDPQLDTGCPSCKRSMFSSAGSDGYKKTVACWYHLYIVTLTCVKCNVDYSVIRWYDPDFLHAWMCKNQPTFMRVATTAPPPVVPTPTMPPLPQVGNCQDCGVKISPFSIRCDKCFQNRKVPKRVDQKNLVAEFMDPLANYPSPGEARAESEKPEGTRDVDKFLKEQQDRLWRSE
jgi:hypothetical protein